MDIPKLVVGTALAVGLLSVGVTSASAQQSSDRERASTVVLKFEKRNVSDEVMEAFYSALEAAIGDHEEMHVTTGGEVTIQEMLVTAGCNEATPDCLSGLKGYIDGERMVFGSIKRSADAYLFTFRMFDFVEGEFVRTVKEQTVEGDKETVKEAIPGSQKGFCTAPSGN